MIAADRELGRDGGLLGAGSHEARFGPAAERQAERIHQDRFARAGLAGQHAQPRPERQRKALDQDDVANGEAEQHAKAEFYGCDDIARARIKPAEAAGNVSVRRFGRE